MAFFRSLFLATALMVFAGSATFAQNMSMDFGNKGGLGFFDPMLCSEDFFEAFRLAGKNPPDPIPEMCAQYSMGHKLMNLPGYGMACVTPMLNATMASIYAACTDCENENELLDLFIIDLPMLPVGDCPTESLRDYEQRIEQNLAEGGEGEIDFQEWESRVNCHHGKKTLGQPPEGQSRSDYIQDAIQTWMEDVLDFDGDTFNELSDLSDRLSMGLNACKLRNCKGVNQCNAVGEGVLVDLLGRDVDIDVNFEEFESIDDVREMADQLMEYFFNR
jgi:hypothetical protein